MNLKFSRLNETQELVLDSVNFESESRKFVLGSNVETDKEFHFDFCFEVNESYSHLEDHQFDVYLFHNSEFAANNIYPVTDTKTKKERNQGRLGFLIPITSLQNAEHDFGTDEHFSPYAFHAISILLKGDPSLPNKVLPIPSTLDINLEEFYGENTHVLILHKPYLEIWEAKHETDFTIDCFFPCLWSYGYLNVQDYNFHELYEDQENGKGADKPENGSLELLSISLKLKSDPFILNLFTSFLYNQRHELIRFHLLYQVIELLIEKVFQNELGSIINDFNGNPDNYYDIREQLSKIANEKSRIDKLFNKYCIGHNALLENLLASCNDLLTTVRPEYEQKSATKALYKIRSIVFHSFRILPAGYQEKLSEINRDFENLIINTLMSFKLPDPAAEIS